MLASRPALMGSTHCQYTERTRSCLHRPHVVPCMAGRQSVELCSAP